MFRVICVDNQFCTSQGGYTPPPLILRGEYTVIREEYSGSLLMYELAEVRPNNRKYFIYDADAFIRLGGPDEVEIAANRKKEVTTITDRVWGRVKKTMGI